MLNFLQHNYLLFELRNLTLAIRQSCNTKMVINLVYFTKYHPKSMALRILTYHTHSAFIITSCQNAAAIQETFNNANIITYKDYK